jgi:hypothetical protein
MMQAYVRAHIRTAVTTDEENLSTDLLQSTLFERHNGLGHCNLRGYAKMFSSERIEISDVICDASSWHSLVPNIGQQCQVE